MTTKSKNALIFTLMLCWGLLIYWNSLNYGFYMDDFSQVVLNKNVHELSRWLTHFTSSTMYTEQDNVAGFYYKPVMMIFYSLLWNINNGDALPFRIFQLLAHIVNSFLVYQFLKIFLDHKNRLFIAAACGLLFLVHPINSEAVLFIADLQEPLYTFFGLLLLLAIQKYKNRTGYLLFSLFGILSLLSKESGVLYILTGLFFVFLFNKEQLKKYIVSFLGVTAVYLFLRIYIANLTSIYSHDMKISTVDTVTRLMTIPKILTHYLILYVFPKNISLTQDWVIETFSIYDFYIPLFIIIALISITIFQLIKLKDKRLWFFAFWFGLGWGLHSQLVPLDGTVSDRWFYFTIVGLTALLLQQLGSSRAIKCAVLCVLIAFSLRSYDRTLDWQSPIHLFSADLKVDPTSFYLNNNLGQALIDVGRPAESVALFKTAATQLKEGSISWCIAMTNLGASYYFTKDYDKALDVLNQAILGRDIKTFRLIAMTYIELGQVKKAKDYVKAGLQLYPADRVLTKISNQIN